MARSDRARSSRVANRCRPRQERPNRPRGSAGRPGRCPPRSSGLPHPRPQYSATSRATIMVTGRIASRGEAGGGLALRCGEKRRGEDPSADGALRGAAGSRAAQGCTDPDHRRCACYRRAARAEHQVVAHARCDRCAHSSSPARKPEKGRISPRADTASRAAMYSSRRSTGITVQG